MTYFATAHARRPSFNRGDDRFAPLNGFVAQRRGTSRMYGSGHRSHDENRGEPYSPPVVFSYSDSHTPRFSVRQAYDQAAMVIRSNKWNTARVLWADGEWDSATQHDTTLSLAQLSNLVQSIVSKYRQTHSARGAAR